MIFMQKGFATLEIIFATMIIAILMGAAIPNAARVIDRVALDYETKKLYTDLRFMQSLGRMTNMNDSHFKTNLDNAINLTIYTDRYIFERFSNSKVYGEHYFSNGVTASKKNGTEIWQITFDDMGKVTPALSNSLTLNSRFKKKTNIIFDSVGRFRGGRG